MAAVLTLGSMGLSGGYVTANASGLPTTDGHNKYVNSEVFSVIGSSDFGSKPLESPLFDKTTGTQDISNLQVPTLAYDESSIGLVWSKPEKYDNVADYNVYIGGVKAGTARENFKVNAEWTAKYMEAFYDYYETASDVEMVNVDIHSYRATDLQPDTEYTFKVVAVDENGKELGTAKEITQKTTAKAEVLNVTDFGAKTIAQWNAEHPEKSTGSDAQGFVNYDDEKDAFVVANTEAIQEAINKCPEGGKVVIPEGTFMSGAVWVKSNMTLEINGTLWASANSDHFEIGFLMYPFYTDTRGWGLVNAMSADESAPVSNIRITGNGTLYGNGWKYGSGDTMYGDGYTSNKGKNTQAGDPDVAGVDNAFGLPRYMGGSNTKVFSYGIQSMDSSIKYLKNVTDADGNKKYTDEQVDALIGKTSASGIDSDDLKNAYATRSSLLIMRNCENVYLGDFTIENPSNHSVNVLDSRNIAANNIKVFSFDGNNGDGLGFGCSQNVICWNNFTDTGDDNLGFGASVGEGARDSEIQTNSEIWMFNNFLREGHGGLAAGSHTGNGIQDVLFEDTVMNHIDMAFRFKSAPTNGGFGANITMRDCAVADTNQGWVLTTSYSDPNSASSTEFAEIGEFYNFASYNVSVYGAVQNTIQVLADVDPVQDESKPWHTHHNLYFQDITFGNVGGNGSFKNKNGWESLIGCENAVFYNFKTVSYNSKAVTKKTDKAWNNLQYCKDIQFQGTTLDLSSTREDARAGITTKLNNLMSGLTVTDKTVTAKEYVEEVVVPDDPAGEELETAWTKKPSEAQDFFNELYALDSTVKVPKYEDAADKDDIGYIWDNSSNAGNTSYPDKLIGYAYKDCDIKDLTKLSLSFARGGTDGTGKVSVRLDSKTGPEIASTVIDAADKDYHDYTMDVVLPEDVDTSAGHKLYLVFTSTNTTAKQKYIGNAKSLSAFKSGSANVKYTKVSVDLLNNGNGMLASTPADAGMYGTVMSLETATVKNDLNAATGEKNSVTIDGITYTDFVQAETAASAGGEVPANGTATFVFNPSVDCSVTLHNKSTSKTWYFVESPDGANVSNKATGGQIDDAMTFNLKAGKTYYYYCQGSKPMVYGIYFNAPVDNADSLLKEETAVEVGGNTESADSKQVQVTWNAVDNGTESSVYYGIDTYIGNQKVDIVDGLTGTEAKISRLSAGVEYTFKVYVSEKGDNANSMSTTGWNKTYIGEATVKLDGTSHTAIQAPETVDASTKNSYYTHTQAAWTNIAKTDERVRGYKFMVNGDVKKTVYNYEIANYDKVDTISKQIGRLTPGMENAIQIIAFTDAGVEYAMNTTATTLKNYDYKAPVFAADAALTARKQENGDVVLTWTAATDDTAVGGYRVYVDGEPVVLEGERDFNPVNGSKTTTEPTYTVTGLDLTKDHTFTVQAGDTWWKAETTMGTFDKMAGFNWTNKGLTTELKVPADYTAVDAAIVTVPADMSGYTDASVQAVTDALAAVDRTLAAADQAKVDAMAKTIKDAVAALVKKPADPEQPAESVVEVPVQAAEDVAVEVKESAISSDAKVVDKETGETVEIQDVQLKVEKATEEKATEIKEALAKKDIVVDKAKDIEYLELSLTTESGAVVKLESGKAKVTLAYKKDIDLSKYDVVVYHLKDNGEIEILSVTAGEETFSFETEGFSPFAVAYVEKKAVTDAPEVQNPSAETPTPEAPAADGQQSSDATATGDSAMPAAYVLLAILALAAVGVILFDKKRKSLR